MTPQERVVAEARTFIGTPYHHRAKLKGVGIDCAQILVAVYSASGVIEDFDTGDYPPDWHLHRGEERYVEIIRRFARELDWWEPILPADVVCWRFGRTFSHGAIVTERPSTVVHAYALYGVVVEEDVNRTTLADRPMRAFRPLGF